jgi:hypothetical protein
MKQVMVEWGMWFRHHEAELKSLEAGSIQVKNQVLAESWWLNNALDPASKA